MQLKDIINKTRILVDCNIKSKKRALEVMSDCFADNSNIACSRDEIFSALNNRERLGSTGIGHGAAIPHARIEHLKSPIACLIILKNDIDFDALDGNRVNILFGLLVPQDANDEHLQLLANIAELLNNSQTQGMFIRAKSTQEIMQLLDNSES